MQLLREELLTANFVIEMPFKPSFNIPHPARHRLHCCDQCRLIDHAVRPFVGSALGSSSLVQELFIPPRGPPLAFGTASQFHIEKYGI
jgi:hypothetical protein